MLKKYGLSINNRFLNFPVKNNAAKLKVSILSGDKAIRKFNLEWAEDEVDFWVFTDVTEFIDQKLTIEITEADEKSTLGTSRSSTEKLENLMAIVQSDEVQGTDDLYKEIHRPQFHFTSKRGWLNDPNGLLFYEGIYHLFYQHNPYGREWGNMHWGHATSTNLVQWQELPTVLYPDQMGTMFSGSGVVDWQNSSDLKQGSNEPIVCLYTAAGSYADPKAPFTQCLMFSQDGAQSWQKYENNPVIPPIAKSTRDPAVIWHRGSQKWIMALYIGEKNLAKKSDENNQHFAIFRSKNLKEWEHLQDLFFPGMGECGELFSLTLDEDVKQVRWIFWTADGNHLIGHFDGHEFIPETEMLKSTYSAVYYEKSTGASFNGGYAAQTWSEIPPEDGRCIQIAWLAGDITDMPFNQQMTFPVELSLRSTDHGPRIHSWPIQEIELLYQETRVLRNIEAAQNPTILPTDQHDLLDMTFEIELDSIGEFELNLRGILLNYDSEKQKLTCCERSTKLKPDAGKIYLRVLLDRASIEIYANYGLVYIPISVVLEQSDLGCSLYVQRGKVTFKKIQISKLNSSWL